MLNAPLLNVGSARFNREPGMSKLARLNTLKISVRNSILVVSENLKRLLKIKSNCSCDKGSRVGVRCYQNVNKEHTEKFYFAIKLKSA